jgi:hypothetical protein
MSSITDELRKDIENLDPGTYYKERICMWQVSKDLRGEFQVANQERQQCGKPDCLTLKGQVRLKAQARSHVPCDSVTARPFDGDIEGEIVFAYIEDGHRRGYHVGKIKWGSATSTLIGQLSGVTNAGTHRRPLPDCEPCDRRGHMEGRLDAVVVDGMPPGGRLRDRFRPRHAGAEHRLLGHSRRRSDLRLREVAGQAAAMTTGSKLVTESPGS